MALESGCRATSDILQRAKEKALPSRTEGMGEFVGLDSHMKIDLQCLP